jgi:hypothetical protein
VLGHLRGGPREPHFEQALRDPPPSPLQQRGGCKLGGFDSIHDCFLVTRTSLRRARAPAEKRWVGHERSRHDPHARQPSCRPRAMRAGSARLHGQSWRGSSVPTSAWPNRHGRAGDRLERPTLCPAPSTRRSPLLLDGLTAAGHAELLATRLSRAATTHYNTMSLIVGLIMIDLTHSRTHSAL